jgi:hypothetical protein
LKTSAALLLNDTLSDLSVVSDPGAVIFLFTLEESLRFVAFRVSLRRALAGVEVAALTALPLCCGLLGGENCAALHTFQQGEIARLMLLLYLGYAVEQRFTNKKRAEFPLNTEKSINHCIYGVCFNDFHYLCGAT